MNVYDQLLKLQYIEHAWEEWKAYRQIVTDYLIENFTDKSEIAIFGAGRCNDVDLKRLLKNFKKVILVDLDQKSMEDALEHQGITKNEHLQLVVADFVGIAPHDYRQFADTLVYTVRQKGLGISMDDLIDIALKELNKLQSQIEVAQLNFGAYTNIAVVGIHSQLLTMLEWIWQAILQTLGQEDMKVRQKIIQMNTGVVARFNEALLKSVQSRLVIGYEIERIGRPGAIQGAMQAAIDFNARVEKGEVHLCDFKQMEWPFNKCQGVVYHMGIFTLENNRA